jgi:hypothetical protein
LEANRVVNTFPGGEGLSGFIKALKKGADKLSDEEKKNYLDLVEKFRAYWEELNKATNKKNKYDDPKTNNGPDAAFDIINQTKKEGKKMKSNEVVVVAKRKKKTVDTTDSTKKKKDE